MGRLCFEHIIIKSALFVKRGEVNIVKYTTYLSIGMMFGSDKIFCTKCKCAKSKNGIKFCSVLYLFGAIFFHHIVNNSTKMGLEISEKVA